MSYLSLVFLLLCLVVSQQAIGTPDGSLVNVLNCKWTKARRAVESGTTEGTAPARAVIPANKNFQRNIRANDPVGARDPNEDTLDGRSAAMEKNVQEARSPSRKLIDGFLYHVKIHNASIKSIDVLFWEYQTIDPVDPSLVTRRQFLCGVEIRPGKEKEIEGFSGSSPSEVVSVGALANKKANALSEKAVINRVEYGDGSIWQRRDWNFQEIKLNYERVLREPWIPGTCKPL